MGMQVRTLGADRDLSVIIVNASLVSSSSPSVKQRWQKLLGTELSEASQVFNLPSLPAMSPAISHVFASSSRRHDIPRSEPDDCFSQW